MRLADVFFCLRHQQALNGGEALTVNSNFNIQGPFINRLEDMLRRLRFRSLSRRPEWEFSAESKAVVAGVTAYCAKVTRKFRVSSLRRVRRLRSIGLRATNVTCGSTRELRVSSFAAYDERYLWQ